MVIYLYALFVAAGAAYLASGPAPGSVSTLLPGALAYLWYAALTVGGGLGLAAALWPDTTTGLLIERVAMLPLGAATLVYATALATLGRVAALLPAGIIAGLGVAAVWRTVQITRQVGAAPAGGRRRRRRRQGPTP
jgi:hypothetical protein